jgi:hypothetical protein
VGREEAVQLGWTDPPQETMGGRRQGTVGFFPVGHPFAQNGFEAFAAGLLDHKPEGLEEREHGAIRGWASAPRHSSSGRLSTDRQTAPEDFDEVLAPQSAEDHALVEQQAAGLAAGSVLVAGLLDLKILTDGFLTHGRWHANGVIIFESPPPLALFQNSAPVSLFMSQCDFN